jgi:LytS/YehU family sensor histidine kinase
MGEDPVQAQDFLDELTKVFRYLLRNNETELTTLAQELDFIRSYYHLLQSRYGKAISMEIRIDKSFEELLIPPLTLQLLIENAVKHNRLQKEEPLHIELVSQAGNRLTVRNNLLKKDGPVESTGIGLQTINARYRMLHHPEAVVEKKDDTFSVVISLIDRVI